MLKVLLKEKKMFDIQEQITKAEQHSVKVADINTLQAEVDRLST